MKSRSLFWSASRTVVLFALSASIFAAENASPVIEEIIVTAQRRSELLQDVPISVSAFDAGTIESRQIDSFSDLQFSVPNTSYTKTNFTGNNFQIRGIGTLLTAASGDSGVGMHINEVYLNAPRLFETEYYDLEQVEILRGPQGTLFGRNATGGVVNMRTARPTLDGFNADIEAQVGNFDHTRLKGAVNIPINESMAFRLAGIMLERDGYSENLLTGNDIDDRDQWSARGSFRWDIGDRTRLDIIGHVFEEDSSRTRFQKQLCSRDPSAILGCLPDSLPTEPLNPFAVAANLLSSNLLLGPLGVANYFDQNADSSLNPANLRQVRVQFEPQYFAEEDFVMADLSHQLSDDLTLDVLAAYQKTFVDSRQDYNGTAEANNSTVTPPGFCSFSPAACTYFGISEGGPLFVSQVQSLDTSLGVLSNEFGLISRNSVVDLSDAHDEQESIEVRLSSSFDGPVNFMLAANYLNFENFGNYFVQAPGLDYPAVVFGNGTLVGNADQFATLAPGYFNTEIEGYELESLGIFGELYWEVSDEVQLTVGLRYNDDDKEIADRQVFLDVPVLVDVASRTTSFFGSDGSLTPVTTIDQLLGAAAAIGDFDADVNTPEGQAHRRDKVSFDEVTGRIVLDYSPDLAVTDDTLFYVSYSRGYKGGGLNPPIDTTLFPNTPEFFEPETINAFEIGTKNRFWDNRAEANMSLFYYDYSGLQIGKVVNRTTINENTDANIFGAEFEFGYAISENWRINSQISYLDSEIENTLSVDPRDPTQGRSDVTLYKDFLTGANCLLEHNGLVSPNDNDVLVTTVLGAGAAYLPTDQDLGAFGGPPGAVIPATPGVPNAAVSSCEAMQAIGPLFGYDFLESVEINLDGNELVQSPRVSFNLGLEHTAFLNNGMSLSSRLDYYWQDEFYTTIFNRPQDLVSSWNLINARIELISANENWSIAAFVQNLQNDDNVTGAFQTGPSAALFTNVFLVEPRLYGVSFSWHY